MRDIVKLAIGSLNKIIEQNILDDFENKLSNNILDDSDQKYIFNILSILINEQNANIKKDKFNELYCFIDGKN